MSDQNMMNYKDTRLYKIESTLNSICTGIYVFNLRSVKNRAASIAAGKLRDNPTYNKPVGIWAEFLLDNNANKAITPSAIATWFKEGGKFRASLLANWKTPSDLLLDIAGAAKDWEALQKKANVKKSERNSEATSAIVKTGEVKTKEYPLYSNWNTANEKISQPDRDFLYGHLRQDALKNLYWVFDNGSVVPIPLSEGSAARKILDDADFWSAFTDENMGRIKEYCRTIIDRCYELRDSMLTDDEDLPTIEEELENLVPHCISRNISIQIHFRKVGSGRQAEWVFDHFSLAMNSQKQALNKTNWCSVLQVDMIKFLDFKEIKTIKQWALDPDVDAIYHAPLIPVIREVSEMPMLPPTFASFFKGKLTNPLMGLLRIAVFVTSIMEPNNYSRQSLVLVGLGKEGKGIFCKFLEHLFGQACVTMQENAFDRENRFGMVPAINKRLIILQDIKQPSSVIESPMFKSITGNDTLSIDRKFQNAMEWKVQGTKLVLVTNKRIWLNNMYAVTRVLPVFFMKNYDDAVAESVNELSDKLILEKEEFLQWCYDYVAYFKGLRNRNDKPFNFITKNGLIIMTDTFFKAWKYGDSLEDEMSRGTLINSAFNEESPANMFEPMFKVKMFDEENEENADTFAKIFDRFFVKNPESKMKGCDISLALVNGTKYDYPEMILAGITRQTTSNGHSETIRNFKKWLLFNGASITRMKGVEYYKGIEVKDELHDIARAKDAVTPVQPPCKNNWDGIV
jgi:hypothetical protein